MDYKDRGTFYLMEHAHTIARDISDTNPVAATAIVTLLSNIKGARAFGRMLIELSSDEWDKLYRLCDEEPEALVSNVIAINAIGFYHNNAEAIIKKNLRFARPALFTTKSLEDPHGLYQKEFSNFCKECTEDFLPRYSTAKNQARR